MTFPSFIKRLHPERLFTGTWAEDMEKAAECTKCGECESKCPYNLPIRQMLEEHRNLYIEGKSKYLAEANQSGSAIYGTWR